MTTVAYDQLYIDDAAQNLGEMFDYLINYKKMDCDESFRMFVYSNVGRNYESGNPRYITGYSGIELASLLIYESTLQWERIEYDLVMELDKSPTYWAGWALAQYQCEKNKRFEDLYNSGLTFSKIIQMYSLHEADISKFYESCDLIIETNRQNSASMLRRLREYHKLTQRALSDKSGVSLRMIQLYEQGQNSIAKAQVSVVCNLAKALDCQVEDLLI